MNLMRKEKLTGETPSPVSPWALAFLLLFLQPFAFGQAGEFSLQEKSEPEGLFPTVDRNVTANTEVLTLAPSLSKNGYAFTHWAINGVRQADANGQALNRLTLNLSADTVAVAHYLNESIDSDDDGVRDWYELRHFGSLQRNRAHDGDGDGISLAKERRFGLNPSIEDDFVEGGVSIRRSGKVLMNFGGGSQLIVKSDPPGLVSTVEYLPETNSTFTTNVLSGKDKGYVFSHWEANGVRRSDLQGAGLNRITETISEDTDLVAKYYREDEDSDGDGVPDWFEWHEFGNLAKDASDDGDGDGFTLDQERRYDLNPNVFDQIAEGGFSMRMAGKVNFTSSSSDANGSLDSDGDGLTNAQEASLGLDPNKADTDGDGFNDGVEISAGSNANDPSSLANFPPSNLWLSNDRVAEERPSGDLVGQVRVSDPDDPNSTGVYGFSLVDGNGSSGNHLFSLDGNGTLRTASVLDYETNGTLRVRIRVTDWLGAGFEKSLPVNVVDLVERNATIPDSPALSLPVWLAGAQAAGRQAPDWFTSPWFGSFHLTSSAWIYHAELGWLHAVNDDSGNAWLWQASQGWLWTGSGIYPWLYRHTDSEWIYFLKSSGGKVYYYRQATESVGEW